MDDVLRQVSAQFGTPTYVYFTDRIVQRLADLRTAFGGRFQLSYAVKCNPNVGLLEWLSTRVEMVDVSSVGELRWAKKSGWALRRASFTGPGKRKFELQEAIGGGLGELVIESLREAVEADQVARELRRVQDVLVRIAPDRVPKGFGDHMAGRPVAFGIDVEDIDEVLPRIQELRNLRLAGFHIYSGTQCLRAQAICDNYDIFIEIFRRVCGRHDVTPRKLVFGSGLGVPYHPGDVPLDLSNVAVRTNNAIDVLLSEPRFSATTMVLELGRYLLAEAGVFLTQVVSSKRSRGTYIAICDGGMNHHLPASGNFGMVVHRPYVMHRVGRAGEETPGIEVVDLVGPLCTSIDRLGRGLELPRLAEGDLIAIHGSGAYGLTASPIHFISHPAPREVLVEGNSLVDVSQAFGAPTTN